MTITSTQELYDVIKSILFDDSLIINTKRTGGDELKVPTLNYINYIKNKEKEPDIEGWKNYYKWSDGKIVFGVDKNTGEPLKLGDNIYYSNSISINKRKVLNRRGDWINNEFEYELELDIQYDLRKDFKNVKLPKTLARNISYYLQSEMNIYSDNLNTKGVLDILKKMFPRKKVEEKNRYNYNSRKYYKEGIQVKFESFTLLFRDEIPLTLIAVRDTNYKEVKSREEILSIVEILKIVFE